MISVSVITIGDELLIGQTLDTNSHFIAVKLNEAGFSITLKLSVGDSQADILKALEIAEGSSEVILMTGGLGPTRDDITKKALAVYFDTSLILNEEALENVTVFFRKRGMSLSDINRMQAYLPANSIAIKNTLGTAPGIWIERGNKVFISMPGVPHEMEHMVESEIIPGLKKKYLTPVLLHKSIMTAGIGESLLSEMIREWEASLPLHMKLAYLPGFGQVKLRLSVHGSDLATLNSEIALKVDELSRLAGKYIYGYDDLTLEQKIGEMLRQNQLYLALAESCTGGNIAHMITTVPGSSDYFLGGIVSYHNRIKVEYTGVLPATLESQGAVSEETVREMASGIRRKFNSHVSLAISGIAGPAGGTEEKPVGLVWMAIEDPLGMVSRKFVFAKSRIVNIEYATVAALTFLWQRLKQISGLEC
ncbi:MAG TPA: CinA family nicotinamide mononucleotide deamidase-related protein [Cyclobacteriaceae bacterium]|nr:CinA family nicotinamide mononucleotide deamidase-related protein [Cyclobacteriaceae bacterium]